MEMHNSLRKCHGMTDVLLGLQQGTLGIHQEKLGYITSNSEEWLAPASPILFV